MGRIEPFAKQTLLSRHGCQGSIHLVFLQSCGEHAAKVDTSNYKLSNFSMSHRWKEVEPGFEPRQPYSEVLISLITTFAMFAVCPHVPGMHKYFTGID